MTGESLPPAARMARLPWWRSAVIYQIWPQSFADVNGDRTGDLPGITASLNYPAELGVNSSPPGNPGHGIAARGRDRQPPRARHRRMACFVSPPNSPPGTDT